MTTPFLRLIYIFFILVNLKSIRGDEIHKQDFKEDVKSGIINSVSVSDSAAKPNIIIFLVDDMGWADTELNGSTFYESPTQIKLANEGMFFSQAYAQPLCSPS